MTLQSPGVESPAVVVVDRSRRILFRNQHAERLIGADPALKEHRGRLECSGFSDGLTLCRVLERPHSSRHANINYLFRPGGKPLLVVISPITAPAVMDLGTLLLIWDPDSLSVSPAAVLCELFDLTEAEVTTALATYDGKTPTEIADGRRRSINTVRTLLSRVFQKCGVKRQAELVRLIADITSMCNVAEGIRIGMGMSRRAFDSAHRYAAWQEAEKALLADIVPYASVEAIGSLHEFSPGQTTTRHYHAHGHEVICVLNGTLRTELANGVAHVTSKSGARYIGSSVVHRGCNPSASESLQVLSINVRQHGTSSRVDLPA